MNSYAQLPALTKKALLLAAVLIGLNFLYQARLSLRAEFTHDDLMNTWSGVSPPLTTLGGDILAFFRPSRTFRPLGVLLCRANFAVSGFDLRPLRWLLLVVLGLNIFLTYCVARRLSQSREIGVIAALVNSYHYNLAYYYYSTGFLFDVLCFCFYFSALAYYLRVRQTGRPLRLHQLLLFCGLYVLALDSKEMAVSLPVVIAAYELLHLPAWPRGRALFTWLWRDLGPAALTAAMTLAYVMGRVINPSGLSEVGGYRLNASIMVYLQQAGHYLDKWLYAQESFTWWKTLAVLVALLVVAGLARSRALALGLVLYVVGVLPVAFIPPRSLTAVSIPIVGLVLYVSTAAVLYRDALLRILFSESWKPLGQVLLFAGVASFMLLVHPNSRQLFVLYQPEYTEIRRVREQLQRLHPRLPERSRVLIVKDPFPGDTYDIWFLIQLAYHDANLTVDTLSRLKPRPGAEAVARYDYVFGYENGGIVEYKAADFAKQFARN